jgi:hypothetical protein
MRTLRASVIKATLVALVLLVFACAVHAQYVSESFTGSSAPQWTFITAAGDGPVLTGNGVIDPVGVGWLRLTAAKTFQNSFVYYNNEIPTKYGLVFNFDFVIWSSSSSNADGFALVIFDADASPVAAGGWGGSLGYAQHTAFSNVGLNGGIAGFGFDTFGNFSNPTEGRIGGPGKSPNSIAIRGSMGATRSLGYQYITGVYGLPVFSKGSASNRTAATVYSVRISISPEKNVTIEWKPAGGSWTTLLNSYPCTLMCPEHIKFGYTASTGSVYSNHEIRNFEVGPLDEPECWNDDDCLDGWICNGDYTCEEQTLIELGSFDASWQPAGITVNWVTETEIDNSNFNLYRAESIETARTGKKNFLKKLGKWLKSKKASKKGPYVKINADPIPALGESPFGASYEFIDNEVQTGKRYWYVLENVDLYGNATQHSPCGPVSAWEDCAHMP